MTCACNAKTQSRILYEYMMYDLYFGSYERNIYTYTRHHDVYILMGLLSIHTLCIVRVD